MSKLNKLLFQAQLERTFFSVILNTQNTLITEGTFQGVMFNILYLFVLSYSVKKLRTPFTLQIFVFQKFRCSHTNVAIADILEN